MSKLVQFREAGRADVPGIFRVRTAVIENALTSRQLGQRGITHESVAASLLADSKGWVGLSADEIVGFSIADRASRSIFALFVLPAFEGRGIGSRLHDSAVGWLWDNGAERVWLTTDPHSKAARFYQRRGWIATGVAQHGDLRYELERPLSRPVAGNLELFIIGRFHARPGRAPEVEAAIQEVSAPTRAEAGCLSYQVLRSISDPALFFIQSRWKDEQAFELHATLPHTVRFLARVEPLIDHPLEVTRASRFL
jgi:quinol monooxygenase YgiN/GNAT superfamily N-acetyltransferase